MKAALVAILIGLLLVAAPVMAEDIDVTAGDSTERLITAEDTELELPEPGILPDSPLYGLKRGFERIQGVFKFTEKSKAEHKVKIAEKRLAEAKAVTGAIARAQHRYYAQELVFTDDINDLDIDVPSGLKYYQNPAAEPGPAGANPIASVQRLPNDEYGTYTVSITEEGNFVCSGGVLGACDKLFP